MPRRLALGLPLLLSAAVFSGTAAGALSVTLGTPSAINVTLDGTDQIAPFTFTMTVTNTGAGQNGGWNLTGSQTDFASGGNSLGYATLTGVTASGCSGGGCNNPVNGVAYPILLSGSAQKIYNAAAGSGKGTNPLTASLTLAVAGNAFAGTYTSTLTISIVSGP